MKKIVLVTVTSLALLGAAGCVGKGPTGGGGIGKGVGKGKAPPIVAPAPAPIITKG